MSGAARSARNPFGHASDLRGAALLTAWYTKLDIFVPAHGRPGTFLLLIVLLTVKRREAADDDFRIDDAGVSAIPNVSCA